LIAGTFKSTKYVRGGPGPIMNPFIVTQGHAVVSEELKIFFEKKKKKKKNSKIFIPFLRVHCGPRRAYKWIYNYSCTSSFRI
jgi:hypothetical protein